MGEFLKEFPEISLKDFWKAFHEKLLEEFWEFQGNTPGDFFKESSGTVSEDIPEEISNGHLWWVSDGISIEIP